MSLTNKTTGGFVWKFFEKIGAQGMQVIIQIILARLLLPSEYGLVGLIAVFIAIGDVVILQGLTSAIIQKSDLEEGDLSSVFYTNILLSIIIYIMLFILAPLIANFYNEPQLMDIMRVLALSLIFNATASVPIAVLSRELDFKKSFYRMMSNVITQGIVGITLAVLGFGPWALVFSKIAGVLVGSIVLWITVRWHPIRVFSMSNVRLLFRFSSKIMGTNILNAFFNNLHSLIIGHYYSATDVGYYQRGQQIPQAVMGSVDGSMSEVLFPAFSKVQGNIAALKRALRRSIKTSMYIILPLLFGLLVTAEPLTLMLLGDKWLPSVPFMQLSSIVCMFWPLSHRSHALNAIGRSDVTLLLSLIGKGVTLVFIFASIRFGVYAIMVGTICSSVVSLFVTSHFVKKHIGYSNRELAQDVLPSLALAGSMAAIVFIIGMVDVHVFIKLILEIIAGTLIYLGGSVLLKMETFVYLKEYIYGFISRHRKGGLSNP